MAFNSNLKARLDSQLRPLAAGATAQGLAGDRLQWIMLAMATGVGALLLVVPTVLPGLHGVLLLLPAALMARTLITAVANLQEQEHADGPRRDPALREVIDAGADVLLYLPLATYPGVAATPVVLLVVLGLLVEISGVAAVANGAERTRTGPMSTSDRAVVFGLVGLILALDPGTAPWLPWLLLPAAAMCLVTIVQRLRRDSLTGKR